MPFETAPLGAKRVAVIGGGISGMGAAYELRIHTKWFCLKPPQSSAATHGPQWPVRTAIYRWTLDFWFSMT